MREAAETEGYKFVFFISVLLSLNKNLYSLSILLSGVFYVLNPSHTCHVWYIYI